MLFPFSRFGFVRNYFIFALFDNKISLVAPATKTTQQNTIRLQQPNNNSPFSRNLIQNNHILFRFQQTLNNKPPFAYAKKQNSPMLFRMKLNIKQRRPQAANKTSQSFYNPYIYDKQLGINKPAVIIADCLFADFRHQCFTMAFRNTCAGIVRDCFLGIKYTTTRLRSPANMFLLRIFVLRYNSIPVGLFPRRVSMFVIIY